MKTTCFLYLTRDFSARVFYVLKTVFTRDRLPSNVLALMTAVLKCVLTNPEDVSNELT